jgi:hypothetical protein
MYLWLSYGITEAAANFRFKTSGLKPPPPFILYGFFDSE